MTEIREKALKASKAKMSERLQIAMWANKVSPEKLASGVGLSAKDIRILAAGQGRWTPDVIVQICTALNLSADYLLGLSDYMWRDR